MGDCQIPLALRCFIEEKGLELVRRNLYRNFVLHCCNLFEFGVVGPALVFAAVARMQQFMDAEQQQQQQQQQQKGQSRKSEIQDGRGDKQPHHWQAQRARWIERMGRKEGAAVAMATATRKDFSGIFPKDDKRAAGGEASSSQR